MADSSAGEPQPQKRRRGGPGRPFPKGVSGNPGGKSKTVAEIEQAIREIHGPRVLEVLEVVRERAMRGDMVASRLYFDRVIGKPRELVELTTPAPKTVVLKFETE